MEEKDKEAYGEELARKAQSALKILKITVILTAVCAVLLPAVCLILAFTVESAVTPIVIMAVALGLFIIVLCVLAAVMVYVKIKIKQLKSLDEEENK